MIKSRIINSIIFQCQKILLWISYHVCKIFVEVQKDLWVVGPVEIANCLKYISGAFPSVFTVNLAINKFYLSNNYNFNLSKYPKWLVPPLYFITGPILLGYLACRSHKFFYIWNTGFLINDIDGREYEFSFLKQNDITIVNYFCGSDIRSLKLSIEHGQSIGYETMASNLVLLNPALLNDEREKFLLQIASVSDKYADHIFNASVDQISYLAKPVHPFMYFYPDTQFRRNDYKFMQLDRIKIVHAPSSPIIKGTQLVRAAVKSLKEQGYDFDYVEITNSDNQMVLEQLSSAHIVINELFAFVPGVLGVEAMASHCALMTSADHRIEPGLPESSDGVWLLTRYWDVAEKLKYLLDNPDQIKVYADKGYQWSYDHCRTSVSQAALQNILGHSV